MITRVEQVSATLSTDIIMHQVTSYAFVLDKKESSN
jgi:hypothetical protein